MDCSPVADAGCVGGEIGMSSELSTKKIEPCVRCEVSVQFSGLAQNCWPGSSIGKTVLIIPADLISALIAPVAPCECPNEPTWADVQLVKEDADGVAGGGQEIRAVQDGLAHNGVVVLCGVNKSTGGRVFREKRAS